MTIKENIHEKVTGPKKAARIIADILSTEEEVDKDKEHVWVIGCDTHYNVKYIELVSMGTLDISWAHPREVFRLAVMKGASSIILVHNHTSGDLTPSRADIETTHKIKKSGEILGIKLLGSLIIDRQGNFQSLMKS